MAVENHMIATDQTENFAVCCTKNMKIEAINDFLAQVLQQEQEESATPLLTVVDNLNTRLWGPTKELRGGNEILMSPFDGLSLLEVSKVLQTIKTTTHSPLDTEWFIVLDEQSEQSSTALLTHVENENVRSVRVAYPVASRYISAASVSHPPLDELIEIAQEESGGILQD